MLKGKKETMAMDFRHARIDSEALQREENEILNTWREAYPQEIQSKGLFIPDGCADPKKYIESPIRLLFVLKEVNGGSDWDLRDFMREGCRPAT